MKNMYKCNGCGKDLNIGDWPHCPHGSVISVSAARFNPVVVFKDKHGNYSFPGKNTDPTPKGMERVEISNIAGVRSLERVVNEQERQRMYNNMEWRARVIDDQRKQMRSTLRKQMETMSPRGRSFAQYAMKRNDAKRSLSQLAAHVDPKFRVSIFSDREADTRTYRSSK